MAKVKQPEASSNTRKYYNTKGRFRAQASENDWFVFKPIPPLSCEVICLSNGKVYKNCANAAREVGRTHSAIRGAAMGKSMYSAGHKWAYLSESVEDSDIKYLMKYGKAVCRVNAFGITVDMPLFLEDAITQRGNDNE